jgi:hypothetical protein
MQINDDGDEEGEAETVAVEDDPEEVTTMSMEDRDSTGECPKCQEKSRTGTECGDTSCTDILMTKSSSRKKASSQMPELRECSGHTVRPPRHEDVQELERSEKTTRHETEQTRARTTRFKIGDEELETVKEFKYLGRITSDDDDDDSGSERNLKKKRARWAQ